MKDLSNGIEKMSRLIFDRCLGCNEALSEEGRSDRKWCSAKCGNKARSRDHYKRHPERFKQKRYLENSDVQRRIYSRIKSRCKVKKIKFNLDIDDIQVPDLCPVLGIEIASAPGSGTNQPSSPSVDRIRPELGYVKGNVRVISNRANLLKSNASVEELTKVLEDLKCVLS